MKALGLRTVDLFAGGGGMSLGFRNAGFKIIAAYDNWEPAIALYSENFQDHPVSKRELSDPQIAGEISDLRPDIIIGGPPCQDFSSAGKRDENLGRADLTLSFAKIISKATPKFFVMENVDRALKSKTFSLAKRVFKEANYGLSIRIIDASLCGVPQLRKRLFVIGELGGEDSFLDYSIDRHLAQKPMTLRDYFGEGLGVEYYYRHPRSYLRRAIFCVDEPSPTVRGINRPVPQGYPGHPGDPVKISDTIRPLTTKERSMIQTFPESFILKGKKTDLEQIIGNAVPVKLAEYVATRLKEYIEQKDEMGAMKRQGSSFDFVLTPPPLFRSKIMQAVHPFGNKTTELKLIGVFKKHSIKGWRRKSGLIGNPDFVFSKKRVAVFVDGCFWHGHNCRKLTPKTNAQYWKEKINGNKERDRKTNFALRKNGWAVIRFWECKLDTKSVMPKLATLMKALSMPKLQKARLSK